MLTVASQSARYRVPEWRLRYESVSVRFVINNYTSLARTRASRSMQKLEYGPRITRVKFMYALGRVHVSSRRQGP